MFFSEYFLLCFVLFGEHIRLCSGFTLGSEPRDHSSKYLGNHMQCWELNQGCPIQVKHLNLCALSPTSLGTFSKVQNWPFIPCPRQESYIYNFIKNLASIRILFCSCKSPILVLSFKYCLDWLVPSWMGEFFDKMEHVPVLYRVPGYIDWKQIKL